ncbi:MAG: dihydrolipoyl dehydrogenase [Spirochaetes bacterium GWB1_36_13]|nr:MAG: dihydrolipoyl dehydrogenase [Spirochaetes bacterium GWB1_36_13]
MQKYDVVIIGGGPAGYKAAEKLAEEKKLVCLIEKNEKHLGGTCLNEGCIPVKSLVESAKVYSHIQESEKFGIVVSSAQPDSSKIQASVLKNTALLQKGLLATLKSKKISLFFGEAEILSSKEIKIHLEEGGFEVVTTDHLLLATGSLVRELPGIPMDGKTVISSKEAVSSFHIPEKLLIIGGGYIGCEFAGIFKKLGSSVTIVEAAPALIIHEDEEIRRTLERECKKKGIFVHCSTKVIDFEIKENAVFVDILIDGKTEETLFFNQVLVCTGRIPNTSIKGIEKLNLKMENGFISVNEKMQTSCSDVYAIGDLIPTPMLAHTAYKEAFIAAESILGNNKSSYQQLHIPRIIFSDPAVGSVGYTEQQLKDHNKDYQVYKKFFKSNGMAVVQQNDTGLIKVLVDPIHHTILGASIIGISAPELIHELVLAMECGLSVAQIKNTIHGHPTLSEIIRDVFES